MNKFIFRKKRPCPSGLAAIWFLGLLATQVWAGSGLELIQINKSCAEMDKDSKGAQVVSMTTQYFAAISSGATEEWKSFNSEPELQTACPKGCYRQAVVYSLSGGPLLASCEFEAGNKEWVQHLKYYFRPDGSLEKIHSDLRKFGAYEKSKGMEQQFLVKALRDYFYDSEGKCIKKSKTRCFNTSNGREVDDAVFTDVPIPVYKQTTKLPFYSLLLKP
jgi:hypothetical protein